MKKNASAKPHSSAPLVVVGAISGRFERACHSDSRWMACNSEVSFEFEVAT